MTFCCNPATTRRENCNNQIDLKFSMGFNPKSLFFLGAESSHIERVIGGNMTNKSRTWIQGRTTRACLLAATTALVLGAGIMQKANAYTSADGTLEVHGFVDSTTHGRLDYGLSKQRMRGQLEFSKYFQPVGPFSEISLHGTLRAAYDAVYDLNDNEFGDGAGGQVTAESTGVPILGPPNVPMLVTATGEPGDNSRYLDTFWGSTGPIPTPVSGFIPLLPGGGGFGFDNVANPNEGLKRVGSELGNRSNDGQFGGGLELFTPVRPCNVDPRGCIDGYLDRDEDNLRFPEFRDDHRWLREIYIDATMPFKNGDELNFRIGRQQVVWGRTDLFRVLDQINPIDYSIQNIYEEFEDSRIPLGIFSAEWRLGATNAFDDLNFQFIWNFEDFTPNDLGQGGTPYNVLGAGDLFRALSNCWHNGCTISNFAQGLSPFGDLATDFPPHMLGVREAHIKNGNDQFGVRMEGVFKSVGFSVNALYFYSQNPSLRGGIPGVNPFLGNVTDPAICGSIPRPPGAIVGDPATDPFALCFINFNPLDPTDAFGVERPRPYVPAFDVHFPRVLLVGGSADFYVDKIKSAFRVELAYTDGEEFADTSQVRLFSESDVIRWVVGWDRPTYWRWLNPNRTFTLSAQVFGQHLLDHERFTTPHGSKIGFQDWDHNFFATFLIQGFYKNDQVQPRILSAYDVRGQAFVVGPQVDWLISDNWRVIAGANFKFGRGRNITHDGRDSNSFPPFTAASQATGANSCSRTPLAPQNFAPGGEFSGQGCRNGYAPLGAFRSGPIGMAQHEDEFSLLIRYRF